MGSKCNHISILDRSYQDLNRITIGQNLSFSGIVCERSFFQIDMNTVSYTWLSMFQIPHQSLQKKTDKKWLSRMTGSQKIFWSRIQTVHKKSLSRMLYFTSHK